MGDQQQKSSSFFYWNPSPPLSSPLTTPNKMIFTAPPNPQCHLFLHSASPFPLLGLCCRKERGEFTVDKMIIDSKTRGLPLSSPLFRRANQPRLRWGEGGRLCCNDHNEETKGGGGSDEGMIEKRTARKAMPLERERPRLQQSLFLSVWHRRYSRFDVLLHVCGRPHRGGLSLLTHTITRVAGWDALVNIPSFLPSAIDASGNVRGEERERRGGPNNN